MHIGHCGPGRSLESMKTKSILYRNIFTSERKVADSKISLLNNKKQADKLEGILLEVMHKKFYKPKSSSLHDFYSISKVCFTKDREEKIEKTLKKEPLMKTEEISKIKSKSPFKNREGIIFPQKLKQYERDKFTRMLNLFEKDQIKIDSFSNEESKYNNLKSSSPIAGIRKESRSSIFNDEIKENSANFSKAEEKYKDLTTYLKCDSTARTFQNSKIIFELDCQGYKSAAAMAQEEADENSKLLIHKDSYIKEKIFRKKKALRGLKICLLRAVRSRISLNNVKINIFLF